MRYSLPAAFLLLLAAAPALAQLSAGGPGTPQPHGPAPDIAPPALPGAGDAPAVATGPVVAKPQSGDPTTVLFAAVNDGDYTAAQEAVSRGADPNAQNSLGETPLDLSIALNRNSITFMLLSARNESGEDSPPPMPAPTAPYVSAHASPQISRARMVAVPPPQPGNDPGVPDPGAGFLGFGGK